MRFQGAKVCDPNEVVVGFDGTEEACDALALARVIADAESSALIVAAAHPGRGGGSAEAPRDYFRRVFARAAHELGDASFTRCEMIDSPARGLHMLADSEGASLIVVGSTHRGRFGQVLPGSVGEQLLAGATCPVAVAPRGFADRPRIRTIGIAYDGGPEAGRALDYGVQVAKHLKANVRVITVGPRYGPLDLLFESSAAAHDRLRERMECGLERIPPEVTAEGRIREGSAAAELAAESRELDLLVIGSRSYGPLRSVLLGNVGADLIRTAWCTTLVIPRGYNPRTLRGPVISGATT
jgi:nucleotide-binding universal stress UspA family protein